MRRNFVWLLNVGLLIGIALASLGGILEQMRRSASFEQPRLSLHGEELPKGGFEREKVDYALLGDSILELDYHVPELRLPDLRKELIYYGQNLRPDAGRTPVFFFSVGQSGEIVPVKPASPTYLIVGEKGGEKMRFSEGNKPTDLWFEVGLQGGQAIVDVSIRDEEGAVHRIPEERAHFALSEESHRQRGAFPWRIGELPVDAAFLTRQGAKWRGRDLFLEKHGGEEFRSFEGKQRVTFGEGEGKYALYLGKGDFLIWKEGRWSAPMEGEATSGFPLLKLEKVDERLLSFTLFDSSGGAKIPLALVKSIDPLAPLPAGDFQFAGARTRVHSMFNLRGQREIVGPKDWFILQEGRWKKLKSVKEINAFVEGKMEGLLLVIEQLIGEGEEKRFEATLYNASRSDFIPVALPLKVDSKKVDSKKEEREGKAKGAPATPVIVPSELSP